jgi:signal transduction histidine kinase
MIPGEEAGVLVEELQRTTDPTLPLAVRLQHVAIRLRDLFQARACAIYLRQKTDATLTLWAYQGDEPPGTGIAYRHPDERAGREGAGPGSGRLAASIQAGDFCLGVVEVRRSSGAEFSQEEAEGLQRVASGLAELIQCAPITGCSLFQSCETYDQARQRLAELSVLYEAGRIVSATLDLSQVLESVARLAAKALKARTAILRLADGETGDLQPVSRFDTEGGVAFASADGQLAEAVRREATPALIPDLRQDARFALQAGDQPASALCAPLFRQEVVIGTLGLYGKLGDSTGEPATFGEPDRQLLMTWSAQAAVAIENARLFSGAEQRATELGALREIGQAITARLELPAVLEAIVAGSMQLLRSQYTQVLLWDEESRQLRYGAALGPEAERVRHQTLELGRGINGTVALTRQPMILDDYQASPYALPEFPDVVATITTPVLFGDRLLGVLHSHTTQPGKRFAPGDLRLLQMLATQAAIAIENARLFHETERLAKDNLLRLREISILNEIGMAMQGTMQLDALLQVILTGVTFGGGLRFNRAILLLVDESRNVLEGCVGVGPSSGEEAARVWSALASPSWSLRELIAERAAHLRERTDVAFDHLARSLMVPLRPEAGVLARTALEGRSFRITGARADPRVRQEWEGRLDVDEFACVPLVAKGKVVGVIAVDNKFNGKPITDEDLEFLSVFATQAGLAVESARTYTRLEEASREIQRSHHQLLHRERLAALGEMAAHVVHEIRNPLVSIGGFARRLARRLLDRDPEGQYAQIIAREVDRLERIVRDVQGMSRETRAALVDTDLHTLLQDCLVLFAERIVQQHVQLRIELDERPPVLPLDPVQLKQAMVNLLANALEAMTDGGTLTIMTRRVWGRQGHAADQSMGPSEGELTSGPAGDLPARPVDESPGRAAREEWVEISVSDTGGGIPQEILDEVFNPFFTTKEAGTGLGLTLVRRIARAHGGSVEVDNQPGKGVTFRIWLPMANVAQGAAAAA